MKECAAGIKVSDCAHRSASGKSWSNIIADNQCRAPGILLFSWRQHAIRICHFIASRRRPILLYIGEMRNREASIYVRIHQHSESNRR